MGIFGVQEELPELLSTGRIPSIRLSNCTALGSSESPLERDRLGEGRYDQAGIQVRGLAS